MSLDFKPIFALNLVKAIHPLKFRANLRSPARQTCPTNFYLCSLEPPIPASYYWYFLALEKNKIFGVPPLYISGQVSLLNMGFRIFNRTWLATTISSQDCLLNPDSCEKGFTIGIKLRLDLSVKSCKQQPRYIIDTGPSVKARGVSLYAVGDTLVARVVSSTKTWEVC